MGVQAPLIASVLASLVEVPGIGIIEAYGSDVPADGVQGYAPGCKFYKVGGTIAAGTMYYENVGTFASANFDARGAATAFLTDSGGFTAVTTVEAALAEHYQHELSVQKQLNIPLGGGILAAGTPMAAWADNAGASAPGITLVDSEAGPAIRWNNQGTQTAVWFGVAMPQDLDDTADVVIHALVSKVGATVGDATTLTFTAFFQTVGALHDADADAGGASNAVVGDAATKTVSELTRTIAAADVPASPSKLSLSVKPTDGTLGTDDFVLHALWLEYKGKLLTS